MSKVLPFAHQNLPRLCPLKRNVNVYKIDWFTSMICGFRLAVTSVTERQIRQIRPGCFDIWNQNSHKLDATQSAAHLSPVAVILTGDVPLIALDVGWNHFHASHTMEGNFEAIKYHSTCGVLMMCGEVLENVDVIRCHACSASSFTSSAKWQQIPCYYTMLDPLIQLNPIDTAETTEWTPFSGAVP